MYFVIQGIGVKDSKSVSWGIVSVHESHDEAEKACWEAAQSASGTFYVAQGLGWLRAEYKMEAMP